MSSVSSLGIKSLFYSSSCSLLHTGKQTWTLKRRDGRKEQQKASGETWGRLTVSKQMRWTEKRPKSGKERRRFVSSLFFFFFFLHEDGDTGRLSAASSLSHLHVVGREKAVGASAHASPPTLVDHLDVGDDVIGVEGYLVVAGWNVSRQRGDEGARGIYRAEEMSISQLPLHGSCHGLSWKKKESCWNFFKWIWPNRIPKLQHKTSLWTLEFYFSLLVILCNLNFTHLLFFNRLG